MSLRGALVFEVNCDGSNAHARESASFGCRRVEHFDCSQAEGSYGSWFGSLLDVAVSLVSVQRYKLIADKVRKEEQQAASTIYEDRACDSWLESLSKSQRATQGVRCACELCGLKIVLGRASI